MTYSIVAWDPITKCMGVGVQTHQFNVGSAVPWAKAGVGAVATQSRAPGLGGKGRGKVELRYGSMGLVLMESGYRASEALNAIRQVDQFAAWRQVAMVDAQGEIAVHTGDRCIPAAGHVTGDGYSVQANMMRSPLVWQAMAKAFEEAHGDLAERICGAMTAAEEAGGDLRGSQSAALLVVSSTRASGPDQESVDLRVEDHQDPVNELCRLVDLKKAYSALGRSESASQAGEFDLAARFRHEVRLCRSASWELRLWTGIEAVNEGRWDEGMEDLKAALGDDPDRREYLRRLVGSAWLDGESAMEIEDRLAGPG